MSSDITPSGNLCIEFNDDGRGYISWCGDPDGFMTGVEMYSDLRKWEDQPGNFIHPTTCIGVGPFAGFEITEHYVLCPTLRGHIVPIIPKDWEAPKFFPLRWKD